MSTPAEVVIGANRKDLEYVITDPDGNPVNVSGGAAYLQGVPTTDGVTKTLNVAGTIVDGANGRFRWAGLGDPDVYVAEAELGEDLDTATWNLRVKFTDAAGKSDFGAQFELAWAKPPDVS